MNAQLGNRNNRDRTSASDPLMRWRWTGRLLQSAERSPILAGMARMKAFALICCIVSLFVQSTAYAAAPSQSAMVAGADCAEMMAHAASPSDAMDPSDTPNCCADMALGCLSTMGCVAPLAMTGPDQPAPTPALINPAAYAAQLASRLYGKLIPPELTPPQTSFAM